MGYTFLFFDDELIEMGQRAPAPVPDFTKRNLTVGADEWSSSVSADDWALNVNADNWSLQVSDT